MNIKKALYLVSIKQQPIVGMDNCKDKLLYVFFFVFFFIELYSICNTYYPIIQYINITPKDDFRSNTISITLQ